jgi:hypothetical protein
MADRGRITADADRYERFECIGRGSYGDVYRGCVCVRAGRAR